MPFPTRCKKPGADPVEINLGSNRRLAFQDPGFDETPRQISGNAGSDETEDQVHTYQCRYCGSKCATACCIGNPYRYIP